MQNLLLGKSETRSLASSLNDRLKRVTIDTNVTLHFPSLRQYDGRGSCSEIYFPGIVPNEIFWDEKVDQNYTNMGYHYKG